MPLTAEEKGVCRSLGINEDAFTAHKLHKKMAQQTAKVTSSVAAERARIARMARSLSLDPMDLALSIATPSLDGVLTSEDAERKLRNAPDRAGKELDRMRELNQFDADDEPESHAANSVKAVRDYLTDPMGDGAIENLSRAAVFALLALEAILAPTGDYAQAHSPAPQPAPPAAE